MIWCDPPRSILRRPTRVLAKLPVIVVSYSDERTVLPHCHVESDVILCLPSHLPTRSQPKSVTRNVNGDRQSSETKQKTSMFSNHQQVLEIKTIKYSRSRDHDGLFRTLNFPLCYLICCSLRRSTTIHFYCGSLLCVSAVVGNVALKFYIISFFQGARRIDLRSATSPTEFPYK